MNLGFLQSKQVICTIHESHERNCKTWVKYHQVNQVILTNPTIIIVQC